MTASGATASGQLRLEVARALDQMRTSMDARLRELREGNEARLAEIQKTVNEQLHAAVEKQMTESFNRVIEQFAAVQKAMGEVQAVAAQIGDIKRLFSNVKTRGGWGETQVRAMLDDILPPGAYETNWQGRAGQRRHGGIRRHHADARRNDGRCCRSTRNSRWRTMNACSPPPTPATPRPSAPPPRPGTPGARRGQENRRQIHLPAGDGGVRRAVSADRRACTPRSPASPA